MNRREFLKLLGAAGAAAAVGPATVLPATAKEPELLVTRYRIGPKSLTDLTHMTSGLVLEAPVGKQCRALIETHEGVIAAVHRIATWNDPGITLTFMGGENRFNEMFSPFDAAYFRNGCDTTLVSTHEIPLQLDYERSPDGPDDLLLMLEYMATPPSPCPPPFSWPTG